MKDLNELTRQELLNELFSANKLFMALSDSQVPRANKAYEYQVARDYLDLVLAEVKRRNDVRSLETVQPNYI